MAALHAACQVYALHCLAHKIIPPAIELLFYLATDHQSSLRTVQYTFFKILLQNKLRIDTHIVLW